MYIIIKRSYCTKYKNTEYHINMTIYNSKSNIICHKKESTKDFFHISLFADVLILKNIFGNIFTIFHIFFSTISLNKNIFIDCVRKNDVFNYSDYNSISKNELDNVDNVKGVTKSLEAGVIIT